MVEVWFTVGTYIQLKQQHINSVLEAFGLQHFKIYKATFKQPGQDTKVGTHAVLVTVCLFS